MPQLYSRMDDINWLTPAIAEILDQGAAPPGGDGSIREQMLFLQRRLGEMETPARVVNVRPTPSHTLFIVKPDIVGRLGNRRQVTATELKRSLGHLAEEKKDWKIGFMPQLQEMADAVGVLLRTDEHQPLSLRRLLIRSNFRSNPSTMAFAIGNTLEQRLIVYDFAEIGNLLVIGAESSKQHFIHSILLTLITLNTPGELRLAIAGPSGDTFKVLINTPHALGRVLAEPADGQRLLDGLGKELERRQEWFKEAGVENLTAYNAFLKDQGKTQLPRILALIDSLSDENWQEGRDQWIPRLRDMLADGGKGGIHLILTAERIHAPDVPSELAELIPITVVTRSSISQFSDKLKGFHGSLTRFIDVLVVEDSEITPVESCIISQQEIEKGIAYWQRMAQQRQQEVRNKPISGTTGVTGMLGQPPETQVIRSEAPVLAPEQAKTSIGTTTVVVPPGTEPIVQRAQALAAYLGWIGIGPLQDILGLSISDAKKLLTLLKSNGIVEDTDSLTPRFIRLADLSEDE